jgi:hypothetical protein
LDVLESLVGLLVIPTELVVYRPFLRSHRSLAETNRIVALLKVSWMCFITSSSWGSGSELVIGLKLDRIHLCQNRNKINLSLDFRQRYTLIDRPFWIPFPPDPDHRRQVALIGDFLPIDIAKPASSIYGMFAKPVPILIGGSVWLAIRFNGLPLGFICPITA